MQHAVVVLCWWCCMCTYMFLHIMLNQAQAKGSVGRVVNHSCCGRWRDREILFSVYLGIYCSTECNITIQKQDPRSKLLHLNSITSPPTVKKRPHSSNWHIPGLVTDLWLGGDIYRLITTSLVFIITMLLRGAPLLLSYRLSCWC